MPERDAAELKPVAWRLWNPAVPSELSARFGRRYGFIRSQRDQAVQIVAGFREEFKANGSEHVVIFVDDFRQSLNKGGGEPVDFARPVKRKECLREVLLNLLNCGFRRW
ncbi:hypothetical protein PT2222_500010 [Paraburkholderia tropica]